MSIMRDFIEEFGGVIAASFLMMMAVSLLTGVFTAVLMLLGISVVVFLVYFFWMHGRAVQVLMEIWFGKIQVKTKQKIFFRPKFFIISSADYERNKVYKIEKENKEFKKMVYYMMGVMPSGGCLLQHLPRFCYRNEFNGKRQIYSFFSLPIV